MEIMRGGEGGKEKVMGEREREEKVRKNTPDNNIMYIP